MTHAPLPPSSPPSPAAPTEAPPDAPPDAHKTAAGPSARGSRRGPGVVWWVPLLIAAIAAIVAFVLTDAGARTYESRAELLAPEGGALSPQEFVAELDGDAVYERTIAALQLDSSVAELRERIDVANTGVVIEILARAGNARDAQTLARVFSSEGQDARVTEHGALLTVHRQPLTPTDPINDDSARNTAAAAAAGLVVGAALALVLAGREPAARHRLDLPALTGWPLLADIPLYPGGAGAPDDTIDALARVIEEQRRARGFRSLLVAGIEDGDGAGVIAVELALALARGGVETTIIDADLIEPAVHPALGIENGAGLRRALQPLPPPPSWLHPDTNHPPPLPLQHFELRNGTGAYPYATQSRPAPLHALTAGALPDGPRSDEGADPDALLRSPQMTELLLSLISDDRLLIISSPPLTAPVTPFLIRQAEAALAVVNGLGGGGSEITGAADALGPLGSRVIGAVITRAGAAEPPVPAPLQERPSRQPPLAPAPLDQAPLEQTQPAQPAAATPQPVLPKTHGPFAGSRPRTQPLAGSTRWPLPGRLGQPRSIEPPNTTPPSTNPGPGTPPETPPDNA